MRKKREATFSKIIIPEELNSTEPEVQDHLKDLQEADSFEKQQTCLTALSAYLRQDGNANQQLIAKLFTYLFLTINPKLPLKKTITRILLNTDLNIVKSNLAQYLQSFMTNSRNESHDKCQKQNEVLSRVLSCVENFPPGLDSVSSIAQEIFSFAVDVFYQLINNIKNDDSTVQTKQDIFTYLHNTTRVLLLLIQKCDLVTIFSDVSVEFASACFYVVESECISYDTKSNCGLLLVYTCNNLPSNVTDGFVYKDCPSLELLRCGFPDDYALNIIGVTNFCNRYVIKVAIYSGILNVVPNTILISVNINEVPIITYLFDELTDCVKLATSNPAHLLEVSRALTLLSRNLDSVPVAVVLPLFKKGLDYVWTHLDHYMDTVRHTTKTVLTNLIRLACKHKLEDNYILITLLFDDLNLLPYSCSARYIGFVLVATEISCNYLLLHTNLVLPHQLLDNLRETSVAPQICNLYEFLMEKHYRELAPGYLEVWRMQWVRIVLPYLRENLETISFYQRLIVSAVKLHPLVLKEIEHFQFQSTVAEFKVLLDCLRISRRAGVEMLLGTREANPSGEDSDKYWRGLIEYKTLDVNMFHQNDEIRLSVLALIVESQKSTALFTEWELNFLRKYLYYNITAETPNTRKQIVATYKKAFIRIKEGLAVLNRMIRSRRGPQVPCASDEGQEDEESESEGLFSEASSPSERSTEENIDFLNMEIEEEFRFELTADVSEALRSKTLYEYFLQHVLRECLLPGLLMDANYPRRSASLELLLFFHYIFPERRWQDIYFDEDMAYMKYNLIYDSYESNKEMFVTLMKQFSPRKMPFMRPTIKLDLKNCLNMASSIKPASTLSAAYTFEVLLLSPYAHDAIKELLGTEDPVGNALVDLIMLLVVQLKSHFKKSQENMYDAAKTVSMYGILSSIRHLMQKTDITQHSATWNTLLTDLVCLCFEIYVHVSPLVNTPSPEGNLPEDMELVVPKNEADESAKAQLLLVFAWRSVKEISLFLGEVAWFAVSFEREFELVLHDLLIPIGEFFIELFIQAKHRGVFEQAYVGFRKLCDGFWKSQNRKLRALPESWLNRMLNILSGEIDESCESLCATRRSAGVPFLILAVLTTEPRPRASKSFHACIKTLLKTSNNVSLENSERRTHCMNVLRAIYRNNQLGELVQPYVAEGMIAAITGCKSTIWGVRNSATLLYSSLMTRIFGVQRTKDSDTLSIKNRMTAKVFFMRYPELHKFLLEELSEGSTNNNSLSLHPILLILSRLYPSNFEETSEIKLEGYLPFINKCLSNPVCRTRELAAKASIPLMASQETVNNIAKLLILLSNLNLKNNECQGLIFQLMHLLKNVPNDHQGLDVPKLVERTFWILICAGKHISYNVTAVYMEVLVLLISVFRKNCMHHEVFQTLMEIIDWHLKTEVKLLSSSAKQYIINLHYLKLYLIGTVLEYRNLLVIYAADEIVLNLSDEDDSIRKFYLNIINYLNFTRPSYRQHSLYVTEDLEISEKEYRIVQALDPEFKKLLLKHLHVNIKVAFITNMCDLFASAECCLPAFMVLRYYPCILNALQPSGQLILNYLVKLCDCDNEELISAVISCISTFVSNLDANFLRLLNFNGVINVLIESVSPAVAVHRRLAICDFLMSVRELFCTRETCLTANQLNDVWSVVVVLLEDDERIVRDTVSRLNTRTDRTTKFPAKIGLDIISERAREELLMICVTILPFKEAIGFLVKWTLRHKPDCIYDDMPGVFNKGYLNLYAETTPVVKVTVKLLNQLLWPLDHGLNYEDKSIFIEEKALLITSTLLNVSIVPMPMIARFTFLQLLYTLRAISEYLETCTIALPTLKADFKRLMVRVQINGQFIKSLNKNDFNNLRIFFWTVYSPILR